MNAGKRNLAVKAHKRKKSTIKAKQKREIQL